MLDSFPLLNSLQKMNWFLAVPKRVNTADLRLPSSERPACEVGPWLASGNLDFRRVPTIPKVSKSGSLRLTCLYTVIYAKHLLWFLEYKVLVHTERPPKEPGPNGNLGCWVFQELPQETFPMCCHNFLLG